MMNLNTAGSNFPGNWTAPSLEQRIAALEAAQKRTEMALSLIGFGHETRIRKLEEAPFAPSIVKEAAGQ